MNSLSVSICCEDLARVQGITPLFQQRVLGIEPGVSLPWGLREDHK